MKAQIVSDTSSYIYGKKKANQTKTIWKDLQGAIYLNIY